MEASHSTDAEVRDAPASLREWLAARPFTLAMSSGFFGFFAHCGFLAALEEAGLRPARLSGSSAGGLVAGLWASGLSAEQLAEELLALRREHFWDPAPGLGLLRGRLFRARLEALLATSRFESCRAALTLSVYDVLGRRTRVLREGELAPALVATCAVPFMFQPVWIGGRPYLDGGILDRPGLAGVASGERVLFHHLTSRSPWRRPGSASLRVPERDEMTTVAIAGLPRVQPFALERGPHALAHATSAARRALDAPVSGRILHV